MLLNAKNIVAIKTTTFARQFTKTIPVKGMREKTWFTKCKPPSLTEESRYVPVARLLQSSASFHESVPAPPSQLTALNKCASSSSNVGRRLQKDLCNCNRVLERGRFRKY